METKTKIIYRRFKQLLIGTWINDEGNEMIFKNIDELTLDWKINGQIEIENQFISAGSEKDDTGYFYSVKGIRMFIYEDFENDKLKIVFKDSFSNIIPEKTLNLKKLRIISI